MPPQAVQTSIAPQQTSTLPPPSLAAAPASSVNPQAVSSNEYTGLGKRSAEDSPKPVPVPTKKTKTVKKEEKPVPAEPPAPTKSHLKPPKQAHSAWQLFFTDRLNEAKASSQPSSKLNVAHVAKDAGELYKHIPAELKQHYAKRAEEARKEYHKQLDAWKAKLTPEDIKQENAFRAGQRKAGKSRKGNMKDTNAPKKPLSAYFLFLKAIRTSGELTKRVFEGEGETTKQSMMAAKKWRSFDDEQKKVSLICRSSPLELTLFCSPSCDRRKPTRPNTKPSRNSTKRTRPPVFEARTRNTVALCHPTPVTRSRMNSFPR